MKKQLKGYFCPNCYGRRLHTVTTKRVATFVIRRYRECVVCNYRLKTKEIIDGAHKQTPEHIAKRIKSRRARRRKLKNVTTS